MSTIVPLLFPSTPTDGERWAALLDRLGNVPAERVHVRSDGRPATEEDLIRFEGEANRLAELVDGVIVEKAMGYYESRLAAVLIGFLHVYLSENDQGIVLAPDGMVRVEGQVREPDVAFYPWTRFPNRLLPQGAVLGVPPDLSVEVLSPSNTRGEMERKRRECFAAGTRLVWEVIPDTRRVRVYTDTDTFTELGEADTLDGGAVLPGFALSIRAWFERAGRRQP